MSETELALLIKFYLLKVMIILWNSINTNGNLLLFVTKDGESPKSFRISLILFNFYLKKNFSFLLEIFINLLSNMETAALYEFL